MPDSGPRASASTQARNYRLVQIDSAFVGLVSASGTFLPVFLARLGATGTELGLLSSLPAFIAFTIAIPFGRWLQRRRSILPWYAGLRLSSWLGYAAMAVAVAVLPRELAVPGILSIWLVAALPGAASLVTFPVVMDGLAGPSGRFELLGRRWAIAGAATSAAVVVAGLALDRLPFPLNFQLLLAGCSLAGVGSFFISRRFVLPSGHGLARRPAEVAAPEGGAERGRTTKGPGLRALLAGERAFVLFEARSLVSTLAIGLMMPLLPLLYVNELHAPDSWIGVIGAAQSVGAVVGYTIARPISRRQGGVAVLLPSLATVAAVPALLSFTAWLPVVVVLSFVGGVAAAGSQLALFDGLMTRIPRHHGVTFSSVDQSLQNLALVVGPTAGGLLYATVGPRPALMVTAAIAFTALALFAADARTSPWRPRLGRIRRAGTRTG